MNLKFILNKRLKDSCVINSGRKHPVSYKHKENKRNYHYQKRKTGVSLNLCTKLHVIMKLYNFLKTSLLSF